MAKAGGRAKAFLGFLYESGECIPWSKFSSRVAKIFQLFQVFSGNVKQTSRIPIEVDAFYTCIHCGAK